MFAAAGLVVGGASSAVSLDAPDIGGATYTALGGSNTCGHGLKKASLASFQQLVYAGLLKKKGVKRLQPSCVPAMGPDYPASCLAYFAPNTTTFATLEFTPNMGEGRELESNGAHLTQMAMQLLQRGVRVVLVSLVPRPPACNKCIEMFRAASVRVERVAADTSLPLVTIPYAETTWNADLKHLNENGHIEVLPTHPSSPLTRHLFAFAFVHVCPPRLLPRALSGGRQGARPFHG